MLKLHTYHLNVWQTFAQVKFSVESLSKRLNTTVCLHLVIKLVPTSTCLRWYLFRGQSGRQSTWRDGGCRGRVFQSDGGYLCFPAGRRSVCCLHFGPAWRPSQTARPDCTTTGHVIEKKNDIQWKRKRVPANALCKVKYRKICGLFDNKTTEKVIMWFKSRSLRQKIETVPTEIQEKKKR